MKRQLIDNYKSNGLTTVLFTIYLIALIWILIFKLGVEFSYMEKRSVNLIPYREPFFYGNIDFSEIILNAVIFIPLGIYAGILFNKWTSGRKIFFFFLTSLIFEGIQFIFRIGAFDVTDIINNTIGGIIGLVVFKAIEIGFNNSVKTHKFINIIAAIGTTLMISLLVLLKTNMLPIRYQ